MKKTTSRIASVLLVLCMLLSGMSLCASAAGNTMSTATSISLGSTYSGSITSTNTADFYKFTLSSSGRVNVRVTAYIYRSSYYIYDANGDEVWSSAYQYWNSTSEQYNKDENVDLTSGTYYFAIKESYNIGNYNFKLSFTSANEDFKETTGGTNNTISTASSVSTGVYYYGQLAANDEKDIYKFTISASGKVNIRLTAYIDDASYYI